MHESRPAEVAVFPKGDLAQQEIAERIDAHLKRGAGCRGQLPCHRAGIDDIPQCFADLLYLHRDETVHTALPRWSQPGRVEHSRPELGVQPVDVFTDEALAGWSPS